MCKGGGEINVLAEHLATLDKICAWDVCVCVCVCIPKCSGPDSDEIKDLIQTSKELLYEYSTVDVYFLRKGCGLAFLWCENVLFSA